MRAVEVDDQPRRALSSTSGTRAMVQACLRRRPDRPPEGCVNGPGGG
jgi:hypothetical protein